jgi:hypothetical protein
VADLHISHQDLDALARTLQSTLESFQNSHEVSGDLAVAVGHRELANKVDEFASAWSIKRGKVEKRLVELYDCVRAIQETFEAVDDELSQKLHDASARAHSVSAAHGSGGKLTGARVGKAP